MKRRDKFLHTTDEWYPCFTGKRVKCSVMRLPTAPKIVRVCVWGADDDGMERDFESQAEATDMYRALPEPLTKKWLTEHGFIRA